MNFFGSLLLRLQPHLWFPLEIISVQFGDYFRSGIICDSEIICGAVKLEGLFLGNIYGGQNMAKNADSCLTCRYFQCLNPQTAAVRQDSRN